MTNNQLCSLVGLSGCFILFCSMMLMLVGVMPAAWGAAAGSLLGVFGLVNFD